MSNNGRRWRILDTPKGPMTVKEAALAFDVPVGTLIARLWRGEDPGTVLRGPKQPERYLKIEMPDGRVLTAHEAAEELGLSYGQFYNRHRRKTLPWQKNDRPSRRRRLYLSPWGRLGLYAIAKKVGISLTALDDRLHRHRWEPCDAFNTPPYGKRGEHFIMPVDEYCRRCMAVIRKEKGADSVQPTPSRAFTSTEVDYETRP